MSNSSTVSQELIVINPDQLKQKCERVLREVLGEKRIGFDELPKASRPNSKVFTLTSSNLTSHARAKHDYRVIPILRAQTGYFWLATTLEFAFHEGHYLLEQVCLIIFQGEATDLKKTPLLRAEWDVTDPGSRSRHAQPHWHVYSSRLNRSTASEFVEFTPEVEVIVFDPQESTAPIDLYWTEGEKFHFAMASRWHLDGVDAHQELCDQDKLLKWLAGCLRYIQDQLIYIYQK
jgi:hypothetical protein